MTSPFKEPSNLSLGEPLHKLICESLQDNKVNIVDIGALILEDHNDLYLGISKYWNSNIIGFEPQLSEKTEIVEENITKTILPYAIGDGTDTSFYTTDFVAASSTIKPNYSLLDTFIALPSMLKMTDESTIKTKKLDEIEEINTCDLLKLDIQGGELAALKGAQNLLKEITVVITETEFTQIYTDQPLFNDIYAYLSSQGFILLNLENLGYGAYKEGIFGDEKSQLLWADAIFIKDYTRFEKLSSTKTLIAFLIAHFALENTGCAAKLLALHDKFHSTDLLPHYQSILQQERQSILEQERNTVDKEPFSFNNFFKS